MSVVSRMEDGVFDHAIDISRFEEGMKRRTIGFLKEMSDDINRLLSDSPTQLQAARLNALLGQVDNVIVDAHRSAKTDMRNQLLDFAPVEEKATTKIMNDSLQANVFSPTMTEAQLRAVVDDSLVRGALASDWWDRLEDNTKNKITKGIQLGIAEGESMSQIKTRLLGRTTGEFETYEVGGKTRRRMKRKGGWIQVSNREAEAVIRTSVHNVASTVRDQTYLNNLDVIDQVESVATLDGRTTPLCASYDGLRWNADTHEPVGGHGKTYRSTPRHWNCRSTHVPVLGELDKLDKIAKTKGVKIPPASRASVSGKQRATMNMDKWLRKQGNDMQDTITGSKAKGNLFRSKKSMKLRDFTDRRGDPLTINALRDKFGIEIEKLAKELKLAAATGTKDAEWFKSSFVNNKNFRPEEGGKRSYLYNAALDSGSELNEVTTKNRTGKNKGGAHYDQVDQAIEMADKELGTRYGDAVYRHEYGHHMDNVLGRKLRSGIPEERRGYKTLVKVAEEIQALDKEYNRLDESLFDELFVRYGLSKSEAEGIRIYHAMNLYRAGKKGRDSTRGSKTGEFDFVNAKFHYNKNWHNHDLSNSNVFEYALRLDEREFLMSAGFKRKYSGKKDWDIKKRKELQDNQRRADHEMSLMGMLEAAERGDIPRKGGYLDKKAVTYRRKVIEKKLEGTGLDYDDIFDALKADTIYNDFEKGMGTPDRKINKIAQAFKDKHAGYIIDEMSGDYTERTQNYYSGQIGKFSDMIGSACKNKFCGAGEFGNGGHPSKYYSDTGYGNTEVFANITALKGANSRFWDVALETFLPRSNDAYKELLERSTKVKWNKESRKSRWGTVHSKETED